MTIIDNSTFSLLPPDFCIGVTTLDHPVSPDFLSPDERAEYSCLGDLRKTEFVASRKLLRYLFKSIGKNEAEFNTKKRPDGKPDGYGGDTRIPIGISHSNSIISACISPYCEVGLDIEIIHRKAHERLRARILHENECQRLTGVDTIQLWSVKESLLKLSGTGLRVAMNTIELNMEREDLFSAITPFGAAIVSSAQVGDLWISVSFNQENVVNG